MHKKFDHHTFEKKWQEQWAKDGIYATTENSKKPKSFVLDMFPYPSGEGLHVGHPKGYIATDVYSRFKRMTGHEVLHPMGWDAFGLPAENFAIKNKTHPRVAVEKNVTRFKEQLSILGFDYDWDREINTTDPAFYKWTQWIFIQLLKKGLAYESNEPINWCPGCQTGLANEDVEPDGTCERCDSVVEKKPMRQWVLKIRDYADRMLADLDTLEWPEHIKEAQRNWIGRSEGAEINFQLSTGDAVKVFTTRPDTLFGATYMVLSPEHELVRKNKAAITNWDDVEAYIKKSSQKEEKDRLDDTKEKTGVKLEGIVATNPANQAEIPIYIADYVLADYGTGAIMAVPAHDERDNEFASKYQIPIVQVVREVFGEPLPNPVPRTAAGAIVYDPKRDKYLVQYSHEFEKYSLIYGGLEVGEDFKDAAIRETLEETGYKAEFTRYISLEEEAHFYHPGKNENRFLIGRQVLLKLSSEEQSPISNEELRKAKPVWLSKEELLKNLNSRDDRAAAERLFNENTIYTGSGSLCNSGEFDGMSSEAAKAAITKKVGGEMKSTYKIKDWVFSRQRYWGEPFPIVRTEDGAVHPIAEEQLPVTLPAVENYEPAGDGRSPLATIENWVHVTGYVTDEGDFMVADDVPKGKTLLKAERETNTMPQWAGSSWYYLRFMDAQNDKSLVSPEREKFWAPVDVYVGGDHAVRHLIYARFWHKFLYDIGVVSTTEPFQRLEFLGFILAEDGRKMSKRWGNVINPDDIVAKVGADTMRVYEMFMGPFENTIAWSTDGLVGARRFLERVHGLSEHVQTNEPETTTKELHKMIKKVSHDIEYFKFNTAISTMMTFINTAEKTGLTPSTYKSFLQLLAPFAPHLTEELWAQEEGSTSIHLSEFPEADAILATDEVLTIGVQVNGKMRGSITLPADATQDEAVAAAESIAGVRRHLGEKEPANIIYVPGKILNLISS